MYPQCAALDVVGGVTRIWCEIPYLVVAGIRTPRLAFVGDYADRCQCTTKTHTYDIGYALFCINKMTMHVPCCVFLFEDTANSFGRDSGWLFSFYLVLWYEAYIPHPPAAVRAYRRFRGTTLFASESSITYGLYRAPPWGVLIDTLSFRQVPAASAEAEVMASKVRNDAMINLSFIGLGP